MSSMEDEEEKDYDYEDDKNQNTENIIQPIRKVETILEAEEYDEDTPGGKFRPFNQLKSNSNVRSFFGKLKKQ